MSASIPKNADALAQACFDGDLDTVRSLLASGFDINAMGRNWTPLHAAIENMHADVVKFLLDAGADPNCRSHNFHPIHHAIDIEIDAATQANATQKPEPVFTELLLIAGADMNAPNSRGQTPLGFAMERWHSRAVEMLRARGAKP
jgi:uncharacterized protein